MKKQGTHNFVNMRVRNLPGRLRPKNLEDYIKTHSFAGQTETLLEIDKASHLPSMILYGPPGTGKTTLARLLSRKKDYVFKTLICTAPIDAKSNVKKEGVINLKIDEAKKTFEAEGKKTALFVDEIHFCSEQSQEQLLTALKEGFLTLIGATIVPPGQIIIPPLLKMCRIVEMKKHTPEGVKMILDTILHDKIRGLGNFPLSIDPDAEKLLCHSTGNVREVIFIIQRVILGHRRHKKVMHTENPNYHITRVKIEEQLEDIKAAKEERKNKPMQTQHLI